MNQFLKKGLLLLGLFTALTMQAQEAKDTVMLNLDKAIDLALAENPTIKVADKDITLKRVADKEAWQQLLPTVTLTGSGSYSIKVAELNLDGRSIKMGTDNAGTYTGALSVSLPVYAPTVYRTMNLTKTDIELAYEKSRASRLDLINQVTQAYYQLVLAQDTYKQLKANHQQAERNYNVVKSKYEVGKVSEYDMLSAEVQMRNLWPNVVSANNAISLASLQLKVLMGVTADVAFKSDDNLENHITEVKYQLQSANELPLDGNTTMRQFDYNEKILQQNRKIALASFLPTLALSYNFQYQSLSNRNFEFWHYRWAPSSTIGLSLNIPLYQASKFTKLKTIRLQQEELTLNRQNTERQIRMQMQSYLNNMTSSAEQLESNKKSIGVAEKNYNIAQKRYEVGRGTMLEVNSAQVYLTEAILSYNNTIYNYLIARSNLENVQGLRDDKLK